MAICNARIDTGTALLAALVDNSSIMVWQRTKDAEKGRNAPKSILDAMLGREKKKKDIEAFRSAEEYMERRAEILSKIKKGG